MSKTALFIGAGCALGFVAAFLVQMAVCDAPAEPAVAAGVGPDRDLARIAKSLEKICEELEHMNDWREFLPQSVPYEVNPVEQAEPGGIQETVPVSSRPPRDAGSNRAPAGWTEHLDRGLARILVENGLTPYDPGVAEIMKPIAARLRNEEAMHSANDQAMEKRMPTERSDPAFEAWGAECLGERDRYLSLRAAILDEFRAAIEALHARAAEGT